MSGNKENYTGGENNSEDVTTGWEDVAKMADKMADSKTRSVDVEPESDNLDLKLVSEITSEDLGREGVWTFGGEGADVDVDADADAGDVDMPPAPVDSGEIMNSTDDVDAESGTGGGVELSGVGLMKAFAYSRRYFESYAEEVSGKTIEEIAPTFIEDEAFFKQAMQDLMGEGDSARSAEDISEQDLINYYNDRKRENIRIHNEMNVEIANKEKSLGFFGRRFGKGAREIKALRSKQSEAWAESIKMEKRLDRLYDMLEKK